jgi:hypothetical protein
MTERVSLTPRILSLEDPVDLLTLAEGSNPFIAVSAILDRSVVTDDIGLLVGGSPDQPTCLFLWVTPLRDLGPWMAHAARWLGLYPRWRRLQGLSPSVAPVKMVLAGAEVGEEARLAVSLLAHPVVLARYICLGYGQSRSLCWDGWEEETDVKSQNALIPRAHGDTGAVAAMSAEEMAFFRRR